MPSFRKKPVEIEARLWDPDSPDFLSVAEWCSGIRIGRNLEIHTLEGKITASPGDWVIEGVQGEFYPCKPEIFNETYEPVEPAVPVVVLPGSEDYWNAYERSSLLEERFPDQDAYSLCMAVSYNDAWPHEMLVDLEMIQEGENESKNWIWRVTFLNDQGDKVAYIGEGGCDFTGWDCQSWFEWSPPIRVE